MKNKLRSNRVYSGLLNSGVDTKNSGYIQNNLIQAKLFNKGLMSRYHTLLLVGQTIVDRQQNFFAHGPQTVVLWDTADQTGMHESTISRTIAGRYLQATRGNFEYKSFFSSALNTTHGQPSGSTAYRFLIEEIINPQNKHKPLGEIEIAKELKRLTHLVLRRTMVKYREKLPKALSQQRKILQ